MPTPSLPPFQHPLSNPSKHYLASVISSFSSFVCLHSPFPLVRTRTEHGKYVNLSLSLSFSLLELVGEVRSCFPPPPKHCGQSRTADDGRLPSASGRSNGREDGYLSTLHFTSRRVASLFRSVSAPLHSLQGPQPPWLCFAASLSSLLFFPRSLPASTSIGEGEREGGRGAKGKKVSVSNK